MKKTRGSPLEVLLIGPPAADIDTLRKLAAASGRKLRLHGVVETGLAVAFLINHSPYELAPRPDLILLDADLGRGADREFLQHLKRSEALRTIPLVTLGEGADALRDYQMRANCQLQRPKNAADWERTLVALEEFWTKVATLPGRLDPE